MSNKFHKILIIAIISVMLLSLCSCYEHSSDAFETEYFKCLRVTDELCLIYDLTDEGKEQEVLILPSHINNYRVSAIGIRWGGYDIASTKLKKLYYTAEIDIERPDLFKQCSALEKIIMLPVDSDFLCTNTVKNSDALGLQASIYVAQDYIRDFTDEGFAYSEVANVSFMNNFSEEINGGYYWLDDLDSGEKITVIPTDPVREGYAFGGWYTEAECVNQWDFENGIKGDSSIKLYAKWIINN